MYNPSYLIQSRHNIYYFRFPLPYQATSRVSVSLNTRCPKEALKLAKLLEYHSNDLLSQMDLKNMDHAEIIAILKNHFSEVMKQTKERIDRDGSLSKEIVENIQDNLRQWNNVINAEVDDIAELLDTEYEEPESDPMKLDLQKAMEHNGLSFAPDSKEYGMMKKAYKHMQHNYLRDVLTYNNSVTDFSFLESSTDKVKQVKEQKHGHKLAKIIKDYLNEKHKEGISARSHEEVSDCLSYLIDWLGEDFLIAKVDDAKAREAKGLLMSTPTGRNKSKLTANLPLLEQIATATEHKMQCLSNVSVNKYLGYFDNLFEWAKNNRYISENNFSGIRVKAEKKKNRRREQFTKPEVAQIIASLDDGKLVKNKSLYWGALIAVYTGARRNEIAGLLPEDIKQDEESGIWYIDINDEEESKKLKTDAAKRIVPIHSNLISLGFLQFVEESKKAGVGIKFKNKQTPRLLYDLTYTEHEKWGRKLGKWFNEKYLPALNLKTKKKVLHSLRHSFITHLSAAGADNAITKSLVGHEADTVTSQVYTHYGIDHLPVFKEAIEKIVY